MKARSIHLGKDSHGQLCFAAIFEDGERVWVDLNVDQVVLITKQGMDIISHCIIAERVP